MPAITSAFAMSASSAAPRTVPTMDTRPPERMVPPSTGAANDARSQSAPMAGEPTPRRLTTRMAATPPRNPLSAWAVTIVRSTGTAEKRATSGLAPVARRYRPRTVRWMSTQTSADVTSDRMKMLGTGPRLPLPIWGRASPMCW